MASEAVLHYMDCLLQPHCASRGLLARLEPEEMLTAAITSARGAPTLAVCNVIGTNVTIVTAALGLSALIFPMVIDRNVRRQAVIATLVSIIPIVLLFLGIVTQLEGVFLLVVFVSYTFFLLRTDREAVKRMAASEGDDDDDADQERPSPPRVPWKPILFTVGGLAAMAVGGPAIMEGALQLAQIIGLSQGADTDAKFSVQDHAKIGFSPQPFVCFPCFLSCCTVWFIQVHCPCMRCMYER